MSDEAETKQAGTGGHGLLWASISVGVVVLYILSPPPLAWLFERMGIRLPSWLKSLFIPLAWLYREFEPVQRFYDAYARLLGVHL